MIEVENIAPNATTLLGRLARLPLTMIPEGAVVRHLRGPARGKKWIAGSGPHSCWLGLNETTKRALFRTVVLPKDVVFDIGANVGAYTILSSVIVGHRGRVYALEPSPTNLEFLRSHCALNHLTNVQVVGKAVAEKAGELRFSETADRVSSKLSDEGGLTVQSVSVDGFVTDGAQAPTCLKIDVEGAEALVLQGAEKTLANHGPMIFLATHGKEVEAECRALLYEAGYETRRIRGYRDELFAWRSDRWLRLPVPESFLMPAGE